VVVIAALAIKFTFGDADDNEALALMALTLIATAVTFCAATIANDNLQDLKTGQLVGATPWKQQVALIIGVVFGSLVIPPVLNLMQHAFGFAGAPGADGKALAAPQAALISSLAKGVLGGSLNWTLLGVGALIGVAVVIADEVLSKVSRFHLPPLAVGMGMYLPMSLTLTIPLGAFLGHLYDRWAERSGGDVERKKRVAILMATGLIVGESLYGVLFAGIVAATGEDDPLAIFPDNTGNLAEIIGVTLFAAVVWGLYKRARSVSKASTDDITASR
jgi:putative OPT family oligopeptide transporter